MWNGSNWSMRQCRDKTPTHLFDEGESLCAYLFHIDQAPMMIKTKLICSCIHVILGVKKWCASSWQDNVTANPTNRDILSSLAESILQHLQDKQLWTSRWISGSCMKMKGWRDERMNGWRNTTWLKSFNGLWMTGIHFYREVSLGLETMRTRRMRPLCYLSVKGSTIAFWLVLQNLPTSDALQKLPKIYPRLEDDASTGVFSRCRGNISRVFSRKVNT